MLRFAGLDKLMSAIEAQGARVQRRPGPRCINDVRRCWAPRPVRPLCRAMMTHEYTYAYGAVDVLNGELDSLILPHVNTDCMQIFLDEFGRAIRCTASSWCSTGPVGMPVPNSDPPRI